MSQMVEYAQLHSGRTHSAGSGPAGLSAAASSQQHQNTSNLSVTTPDSSYQMTSTTLRSPPANPYLAASTASPRAQSPVRAGSAASVPAHMHFRKNGGGSARAGGSAEAQRSPHPPKSARSAAESTKVQSDETTGGSSGSSALTAVSWLTPSKPKGNKPAAAEEPAPAEPDADAEDRAAAIRIADLKAWLSRAGKVKPRLWQSSQHATPSQLQQNMSSLSRPPPVPGATPPPINTTGSGSGLLLSSSQRPASAAAYSPRYVHQFCVCNFCRVSETVPDTWIDRGVSFAAACAVRIRLIVAVRCGYQTNCELTKFMAEVQPPRTVGRHRKT